MSKKQARQPKNPIRLMDAWKGLKALTADPDRTDQVFVIIDALSGNTGERLYERFAATAVGERVLREERDILSVLSDREALLQLPDGSLGKTYGEFMTAEQISADGLVEASEEGGRGPNEDANRSRFGMRLRDTHDLWHVTTGYSRDLLGEASLLAFTFAQTRNPGIGLIVAMAFVKSGGLPRARRMIFEAYRRGRKASWLPAVDWEASLARPLDEVRSDLGIGEVPQYEEVRSAAGELALKSH